ncbi:MAG: nucleotidyl transferase AbiEii/AbiGii toxin family protein [Chthoniobacterales bacterium]
MTAKQFFDWQTAGGANDVVRLIDTLEKAEIAWCAIGGVAVNHWAREPMVTRDVDFVVESGVIDAAVRALEMAGLRSERFEWSINFQGDSAVSMQLSTEDFYREFPSRAVAADVHGILLRVASLEDTLSGKIKAWSDEDRRQSKQIKDLADIARLVEAHASLWEKLPAGLKEKIRRPGDS